jgi:hypothetical protein
MIEGRRRFTVPHEEERPVDARIRRAADALLVRHLRRRGALQQVHAGDPALRAERRSATIAPSSARQFAVPTWLKFCRPFAPSMSVVQPSPDFIIEHPATKVRDAAATPNAATIVVLRFMVSSRVIGLPC